LQFLLHATNTSATSVSGNFCPTVWLVDLLLNMCRHFRCAYPTGSPMRCRL